MLAAGVIMMTACEKEDNDLALSNANESKSSVNNVKSGDSFPAGYWDDLQLFIYNVMEEDPHDDMEIEQALYYTESALDWQLVNVDRNNFSYRQVGDELVFAVYDLNSNGSDYEIEAADLLSLNEEIRDDISEQASDLANESGDSTFIQAIDLTWTLDGSGNAEVFANVLYGFGSQLLMSSPCGFVGTFAGVRQYCSPISTSNTNGHELIDLFTSPLTGCGTWRDKFTCNPGNHMIMNTRTSHLDGVSGCGFTFFSGSVTTCLMPVMHGGIKGLEEHHDDAQDAWNNYCSSISNINSKLRTVFYGGDYNLSNVAFEADYYTAKCRTVTIDPGDPEIYRPCCLVWF